MNKEPTTYLRRRDPLTDVTVKMAIEHCSKVALSGEPASFTVPFARSGEIGYIDIDTKEAMAL